MGGKVIWTDRAIADLESLVAFIARRDPDAARKTGHAILDHARILEQFPLIGPVFREADNPTVHHIVCGSYRVFYRVKSDSRVAEILHVRHSAQGEPSL